MASWFWPKSPKLSMECSHCGEFTEIVGAIPETVLCGACEWMFVARNSPQGIGAWWRLEIQILDVYPKWRVWP
jgi:hypothetical protein